MKAEMNVKEEQQQTIKESVYRNLVHIHEWQFYKKLFRLVVNPGVYSKDLLFPFSCIHEMT